MRKLIVIEEDGFVRDFIVSGAFDALDDDDTYYVSGELSEPGRLEERGGNYLGAIVQPTERKQPYHWLRKVLLASYRFRSAAQRKKLETQPWITRLRLKFWSLPGIRQAVIRRTLGRLGLHPQLHGIMAELRPDIVLFPTGGVDTLTFDAARSARALGIPSVSIVYSWDNLSIKGVFPSESDYYAVTGEQSREIAWNIHRISPDRVFLAGSPYIDHHFHHTPGSTDSPFPFAYALFIGGSLKFHEASALETLEQEIERHSLPLKVVYRPHPNRLPRDVPDLFEESRFKHVVLDPQVRERYLSGFTAEGDVKPSLPALDYYPALLEHCAFAISPLTTMMLEAAIFERQVIVVAYSDGIHRESADWIWTWDFAEGMEFVEGFHMAREADDLPHLFTELATGSRGGDRSVRDQIGHIIHNDERTYGERLAAIVEEIGARHGVSAGTGADVLDAIEPPAPAPAAR